VNVFQSSGGYVIALTYGAEADWVRNVLAAGGCTLHARGRALMLTDPRLFHDESRQQIRPLERHVLRVLRVSDFLSLQTAAAAATPA
jgi:hypothetical protein